MSFFSFRVKGFWFEGGVKKPTGGRLFWKFHLTHFCALKLSYPKWGEESSLSHLVGFVAIPLGLVFSNFLFASSEGSYLHADQSTKDAKDT